MNTWEDFDCEARTVERFTKAQFPDSVQLLQDAVGLFADAFSIADDSDTSDVNKAKMSLLSNNFNTLKCAVDLALRGYYSQSMNLLRHVYENWIAFHYLIKKPEEAHVLLDGRIKKRLPDPSIMRNELDGEDFFKKRLGEWYSMFYCFAHPHAAGVLPLISDTVVPGETSIHFGATYDDKNFKRSVSVISIWTVVMLDEVGQWISNTNEWDQKRSLLVEKVQRFIDEENKKLVKT